MTNNPNYHLVRGLQRGLVVLQALNRLGEASSAQIAAATDLPRPTAHRLLETLRSLGFVDRAKLRDTYKLTSLVDTLSRGYTAYDRLTEVATPKMAELFKIVVWPTDLATYHDGGMTLRVTTHHISPLSLARVQPGKRVPMLNTAVGTAYLAFCPQHERDSILDILSNGTGEDSRLIRQRRSVERMLEAVREQGYGIRILANDNKTSSIAVPIRCNERVLGCLTVSWFNSAMTLDVAIQRLLAPLRNTANEIEEDMAHAAADDDLLEPAIEC